MPLKDGLLNQDPAQLPFQEPRQIALLEVPGEKVGVIVVGLEEVLPLVTVLAGAGAAGRMTQMDNRGGRVVRDLIAAA